MQVRWYGDAGTSGTRGAVRGVRWCDVGGTMVRHGGVQWDGVGVQWYDVGGAMVRCRWGNGTM